MEGTHASARGFLCIVANIRNEQDGIIEWLEYHFAHADVDHAFLWLDRCTDSTRDLLRPLVAQGRVTINECDYSKGWWTKDHPFNQAIRSLPGRFRWAAVIDSDEFLRPVGAHQTVRGILEEAGGNPAIGGLAVNWRIFGSGMHHTTAADKAVLASYCIREADRREAIVKTIVNLDRFKGFYHGCPHVPIARPGHPPIVSMAGDVVRSSSCRGAYDRLVLHHYFTKSFQFWVSNKIPKGDLMQNEHGRGHYRTSVWFDFTTPMAQWPCVVFDDSLAAFATRPAAPLRILSGEEENPRPIHVRMAEWADRGFPEEALEGVDAPPTTDREVYAVWKRWTGFRENGMPNRYNTGSIDMDEEWYLERYPDVRASGMDAHAHFTDHGWREGRFRNAADEAARSCAGLDPKWYLERYPDVRESGMDPRAHFANHGWREGGRFRNADEEEAGR